MNLDKPKLPTGTVTLKHLRYFVAVAEDLHFGRAAERLGMSQPPLSQQIQKLERAVGHTLFRRKPRVELTPAGDAFLAAARHALAGVDRALESARRAGRGEIGHVTVGFAASAAASALPRIIRACKEELPDISLGLRELHTAEQAEALRTGEIDLGFLREPIPDDSLLAEMRIEESLIAILPAEHPLAGRETLQLGDLATEPFVLFPRAVAPGLHDRVTAICSEAGFVPNVRQEAREWLTIVALVEGGLGVSLVPASFRRLRWGNVVYLDLDPSAPIATLVLCRANGRLTPAMKSFLAIARATLEPPIG